MERTVKIEARTLQSAAITALFWAVLTALMALVPVRRPETKPHFTEIAIKLEGWEAAPSVPLEETPVNQDVPFVPSALPGPAEPVIAEPIATPEPVAVAPEAAPAVEVPPPKSVAAPKTEPLKTVEPPATTAPVAPPVEPSAPKVEATKTEAPKAVVTPAAPVTPAPQKAEPVQQTLTKSIDELMAEQNAAASPKKTVAEVDWDALFGDDSVESQSSAASAPLTAKGSSTTSGTAASATTAATTAVSATSGRETTAEGVRTVSAAVAGSLGKVRRTYTDTSGGGVQGELVIETTESEPSSTRGTGIVLSDGTERRLVDPAEPRITIPAEYERDIPASCTVTISFSVLAGGTVPQTSVTVTPASLLPEAVIASIKSQISRWRFESASSDGQAAFAYSIIKQ